MPSVIVIHATGGPRRDEASLRLEWVTSMLDGLALAGARVPDDLDAGIVSLDGADVDDRAPLTPWEDEVVARWWRSARFEGAFADRRDDPSDPLPELGRSRYFTGLPPDELVRTVRVMTSVLVADEAGRAAARRVADAITPETRVVVGFGLGAVPAMDALSAADHAGSVDTLITIGSPLALRWAPSLPGRSAPPASLPAVRAWVNLVDVGDTLAEGGGLARHYGEAVQDVSLDCDPRLRAPRPYAATAEFGRALAGAPFGTDVPV